MSAVCSIQLAEMDPLDGTLQIFQNTNVEIREELFLGLMQNQKIETYQLQRRATHTHTHRVKNILYMIQKCVI